MAQLVDEVRHSRQELSNVLARMDTSMQSLGRVARAHRERRRLARAAARE